MALYMLFPTLPQTKQNISPDNNSLPQLPSQLVDHRCDLILHVVW